MKKLIILLLTMSSSIALCALRYDSKTCKYYSENAPKNVDQDEYNTLVNRITIYCYSIGLDELTDNDLANVFSSLRMIGTPAALRLIVDVEELIKTYNQDLMRIRKL